MIMVDDILLSEELFEKKFVCDLNACKGACCVEGDSGAPVEADEVDKISEAYEQVKHLLRPEGIEAIGKDGAFVVDFDGEYVTPLVNEKECAYTIFDPNGTAKCGLEEGFNQGLTTWKKPESCSLYPIRIGKLKYHQSLNYHQWDICKPACECGGKLDVKVFRFLKGPLTAKYGAAFYEQLEEVDKLLTDEKDGKVEFETGDELQ